MTGEKSSSQLYDIEFISSFHHKITYDKVPAIYTESVSKRRVSSSQKIHGARFLGVGNNITTKYWYTIPSRPLKERVRTNFLLSYLGGSAVAPPPSSPDTLFRSGEGVRRPTGNILWKRRGHWPMVQFFVWDLNESWTLCSSQKCDSTPILKVSAQKDDACRKKSLRQNLFRKIQISVICHFSRFF